MNEKKEKDVFREGPEKKGGINNPPKNPKPDIEVPGQTVDWKKIKALKKNFKNIMSDEKFQKVQNFLKSPKITQQKFDDCGIYNAVAVDIIPAQVVSITDAGKEKITWKIIGQQIVCNRNLEPPLIVEYITKEDMDIWAQELAKLLREENGLKK